jgi:peptidylprolyl isomerase
LSKLFAAAALAASLLFSTSGADAQAPKKETLEIELATGKVVIELLSNLAPKHVERVKLLAREGYYNNVKFHRVIRGFMAQTGDHTGTGRGGSKHGKLPAEFSSYVYKRGTVGAARTQDPNSANSQFFICFDDRGCRGLTNKYTVWGQVIEGMENVDKIAVGEPPAKPDVMKKVTVGSR